MAQIIDLIQSNKTTKEIDETNQIWLPAIQRIAKTYKDSGEPSSLRNK